MSIQTNTTRNIFEVAQQQQCDNAKARYILTIDASNRAHFVYVNSKTIANYECINVNYVHDYNGEIYGVDVYKAKNDDLDIVKPCYDCGAKHLTTSVVIEDKKHNNIIGGIMASRNAKLYATDTIDEERFLCDDCADCYDVCDHCGTLIIDGDTHNVYNDYGDVEYYCDDCVNNYTWQCDDCGCLFTDDCTQYECEGDVICDRCTDNDTAICGGCGQRFYTSHLSYDDDNDEYYCTNCEGDYNHHAIGHYHDSHHMTKYWHNKTAGDYRYYSDVEYIGTENETSHAHSDTEALKIASKVRALDPDYKHFFIEHDGSLDYGFEMISQPFTIEALNDDATMIQKALEIAQQDGMRAHDTRDCGMHIHFSRCILGNTTKKQYNTIIRLVDFFDQFSDDLELLNRRGYNDYNERYELDTRYYDTRRDAIRDVLPADGHGGDRYYCINLSNQNTIEIRSPRGTLNVATYRATIRFYYDLLHACRDLSSADFYDGENIQLNNVLSNQSQEAIDYMQQRGCFTSFTSKIKALNDAIYSASIN